MECLRFLETEILYSLAEGQIIPCFLTSMPQLSLEQMEMSEVLRAAPALLLPTAKKGF